MPTGRKTRCGVVKALTLPYHAAELLEELAPSAKSYGLFLGELLAAEAARREARALAKAQREQERDTMPTRESWQQSGCNVD